ncbi:hypothetical protein [Moraxella lacunata]
MNVLAELLFVKNSEWSVQYSLLNQLPILNRYVLNHDLKNLVHKENCHF